jgi:type VI secretion system protein ImpJ
VLPSYNRVVDYPGNAHVVSSPVALGELKKPAIYFFVLEALDSGDDPNKLTNQSSREVIHRYFKLVFSSTSHFPNEMENLLADYDIEYQGCLAIFEQDTQGFWGVTDQYIPPLLQVGNSPYLRTSLNKLNAQLQRYRESLQASYVGEPLPLKQYVNASNCVRSVQSTLFLLKNLSCLNPEPGEISPHPYDLYEDLHQLYLDLSLYREIWPESEVLPYRHLQIHYIFQQLLLAIAPLLLSDSAYGRSSQFVLKEGVLATPLPAQTEKTDLLYFVIKLHERTQIKKTDLPKISCLSRLTMMYDYSLNGLRLTEVEETELSFSFGSNIQCFHIEKDQELEYLFAEKSVAFYDHPDLKGREYFIYSQPL